MSTFHEEVYNQELMIASKKLGTLYLFIDKVGGKCHLLDWENFNTIGTKLQLTINWKDQTILMRMTWEAIMYNTGYDQNRNVDNYGLKILHSSKQSKKSLYLRKIIKLDIEDIKFRNTRKDFQTTLQENVILIHNSKKTMTLADKTSNTDLQKVNTTNY